MTSARYRLIHFVPDPFLGGRVPVGAMVQAGGLVTVLPVKHVPGAACLGSPARAAAASMLVDELASVSAFDSLPVSLGPQAVLDLPREVPAGVDPRMWVEKALLEPLAVESSGVRQTPPHRATFGFRFLENYGLKPWVQKSFKPGRSVPGLWPNARVLGTVSHYVVGAHEVMLMEPLLPSRPGVNDELKHVAQLFGAYRTAIAKEPRGLDAKFVAYVLAGGSDALRSSLSATLRDFADDVVDTTNVDKRVAFVTRVREVGQSAAPSMI
jgi:hypothetical protein